LEECEILSQEATLSLVNLIHFFCSLGWFDLE